MKIKIVSTLLVFLCCLHLTNAETVNLDERLQEELDIWRTPQINNLIKSTDLFSVINLLKISFLKSLKISEVKIIPLEPLIITTKPGVIPNAISTLIDTHANCTQSQESIDKTLTSNETYKTGSLYSFTNNVNTSSENSLNLSLKLGDSTLSNNNKNIVTITTGKTTTNTIDETTNNTLSERVVDQIPPMTKRYYIISQLIGFGYYDLNGNISADATLTPYDPSYLSSNKLSKIIDNEKLLFNIKGELATFSVKEKRFQRIDEKLTIDHPDCLIPKSKFPENITSAIRVNELSNISLSEIEPIQSESYSEVIEPLINNMNIHTGNVVANLLVRAKSLSLGFCATKVSTNTKEVGILAPPQMWSDWYTLDSYLGETSFDINSSIECDTDVIFEIKYFK
ncbi:hypothetical protein KTJ62_00355 [Acinetobacter sp. WU_MDCI_Abxa265]|uniref:hypothetical protein n=1 Tax=Acinetobacter sp. WU_MDCI_Abxa265 TaxID=2850077 RepID=UPI0021CD9E7F|nr:hypothetical protein [Acinetobacter sp. WU_MDCI_Abxa265]MCU4634835.1 hypothetical protein [Acinetobacter sp. WU_MDCI_Abxa265]